MNIRPISTNLGNKTRFCGEKHINDNSKTTSHSSLGITVPLATLIAMSPLTTVDTYAQDRLPDKPNEILMKNREKEQPKTKILDVKTFFNVNGENYIVRTKSNDGDHSDFEEVTISQATPNSKGTRYAAKEVAKYNFAPYTDDEANNGFFTIDGIQAEDENENGKLIGNEEFIKYFENIANSDENNGAIEIINHNENLVPLPTGRVVVTYEDGNPWKNADKYIPEGEFLGNKILEGDNGVYNISIYNSDKQTLTAEEFTLKKAGYPELKIDKMIKVTSSFVTDHNNPISYQTYQFNLKDNDGVTTIIYDKTHGEYIEKKKKSTLYNKKQPPFEKTVVEKNYKILTGNEKY